MSTRSSKFSSGLLLLAMAAPVALGAFGLLVAFGGPLARKWFWPAAETGIVEAAALGDSARVRALAAAGASLDLPGPVRPELREDDAPSEMSALEAAVRRRSDSLVGMLIELGARPSPDEARRLVCLARGDDDPGTAAVLEQAFAVPASACDDQDAPVQPAATQ